MKSGVSRCDRKEKQGIVMLVDITKELFDLYNNNNIYLQKFWTANM